MNVFTKNLLEVYPTKNHKYQPHVGTGGKRITKVSRRDHLRSMNVRMSWQYFH